MVMNCSLSKPWIDNDFAPCFRETIIDGYFVLILLTCSFIIIFKATIKHYKSHNSGYSPLLKLSTNANIYYGSIDNTEQDSSSDTTTTADVEIKTSRWTVYNLSRLFFSILQFGLFIHHVQKIHKQQYELTPNEGKISDLVFAVTARTIFWAYATILSIVNIYLSSSFNKLANKICNQLNFFYVIDFMITLVDIRSYYLVNTDIHGNPGYLLSAISGTAELVLISIIMNESRLTPKKPIITENGRVLSGESWASFYSKFMFNWMNTTMKEGYKRTLNDKDLIELPSDYRTKNTIMDYKKYKTSTNIKATIVKTFKWPLFVQFCYCLGWSILVFGPPFFLNKIVKYIEDPKDEPVTTAYCYTVGLFVTNIAQLLLQQQGVYIGRTLGVRIQSIIIGEVFSKSLRRRDETGSSSKDPSDEKEAEAKGNINNLLSVDTQKIAEIGAYFFYVYCYPLQIIISVWSLYKLLGNAALWGVLVMILCQPITYLIQRRLKTIQANVMATSDKRLKLTSEFLSAIRIVKFFAWESEFKKRLTAARDDELSAIRSRLIMYMWMINAWFFIPIMIMVATFYVYTTETALTASVAFTALALFNTFRAALDEFPILIFFVISANVSVKRIENFLDDNEVDVPAQVSNEAAQHSIVVGFMNNASFSWESGKNAKPSIKNLNLNFPVNKLSIICGPTGSGKTTLIASLLGETHCLSGQPVLPRIVPNKTSVLGGAVSGIAYVAQTAWLQNCSIRDNILFGLPFDEERYDAVLYMTALTRDLEILEFGDATEIGEKGITLSGGQKQRVAIARAVYSQATTVILDDCLSAVDAHTAKHLYENCLTGNLMKDRTIILVTHHVGLCLGGAEYVVAVKDGEVVQAGSPKELLNSGVLSEELSKADEEKKNENEEAAVDGPIPTVPKVACKKTSDGKGGKLTQEEKRAEGSVSWSVYKAYIKASGGYFFWFAVLFFFSVAQATALAQDYWIKVWSASYVNNSSKSNMTSSEYTTFPNSDQSNSMNTIAESIDVKYYLGIYFLIGVIGLVMTSLRTFILFNGSLRASKRMYNQLLNKMLRAKVRFYDTTPIGRIVNRFSSDLQAIDQEIAPSLAFLIYSVVSTVCVILLISAITPIFLIPDIIIAILFFIIGDYYLCTSRDLKRLNSVAHSPIYVQFSEAVNGISTIRAFGSQLRFIKDNYEKIDNSNRTFLWMWATNCWLHCRVDLLGAFVGFCAGFFLILSRAWIDPGLAGLSLSYALTFTYHMLWVVRQYAMNEMNMNAIERVHEYLDIEEEPSAYIPETEPRLSWPEEGSIQVKNLVMQYAAESQPVLRDVSFHVKPREKVGIVGRTGSGKSTLALSIFRFMEPTSGSIEIDGVDIHKIGLHTLRSRLTIIPQDPILFTGTLRSNLDPFNQYNDAELWNALKRVHLTNDTNDNADNSISLDSAVAENGSNWSQGQRQLIALARALVKKSSLIILDEATSSVDFDTDHKIQQTIRSEFADSALLCIAHRIRTVADYDRILVLDHGEVKEFDTPYNLMTQKDSIFQQMCIRSGEYDELLAIAKTKETQSF